MLNQMTLISGTHPLHGIPMHVNVAAVPPVREPVGRRNVSITVNFKINKVLMYKFSSSFIFAVSEVEFFTCCGK